MKSLVITDKDLAADLFKKSVIVNLNNLRYSFCTGGLECLKNEGQCYFYDDMSTLSLHKAQAQALREAYKKWLNQK